MDDSSLWFCQKWNLKKFAEQDEKEKKMNTDAEHNDEDDENTVPMSSTLPLLHVDDGVKKDVVTFVLRRRGARLRRMRISLGNRKP